MKSTVLYLMIFVGLLIFDFNSYAQQTNSAKPLISPVEKEIYPKYQIGAAASSISGSGITAAMIFDDTYRLKFTGIYYYTKNNSDESGWTSIGMEFQFNFLKVKLLRCYGYLGTSYWYTSDSKSLDTFAIQYSHSSAKSSDFRVGMGLGFDLTLWGRFVMGADLGYNYQSVTNTYNKLLSGDSPYSKYIGIGGGITVGFIVY